MTDAELVEALAAGDESALAALHKKHFAPLVRLAQLIVKDAARAEDVVQEVFVRLWDEPSRYEATRGTVAGFLRTWVRSRALDATRRDSARQRAQERASDRVPELLEPISRADKTGLENALAELPAEQRELVEKMYYEGRTQRQIASDMGIALGTVKSRIRLGMERMRDRFRATHERDLPPVRGQGARDPRE